MFKKIKKPIFSEGTRRIITYLIYLAFAVYTIVKCVQEPSVVGRVSYSILLLVILGFALWAEYLRILYYHMISCETMYCDPAKAKQYYHKLEKKDFLKSYKHSLHVFNTLYYQDLNQSQRCIQIIEDYDKLFHSSLDMVLIRYYTYFYSYYRLGNRTKVKKYYPEVMKMRGAKIKGSKVTPLYNWEYIEAIYLYVMKDYKKSLVAFHNVNTKNFNQRELAQYFLDFGKLYRTLQDKENAIIMFNKVIEAGNQLVYAKEAKAFLKKI